MDISPFETHGPLEPDAVHGRDALLEDLIRRITSRRVTALVGPRRYGKTSVLRRVQAEMSEVSTIWVDLWGTTSIAEVAAAFEDSISRAGPSFVRAAEPIAASLQLEFGFVRASLSRPAARRPDYGAVLPSLINTITTVAEQVPTLLVMDEFSAIAGIKGVAAKLRTALQHHYKALGIVFAGSEPSTMEMLFTGRSQPFYSQADFVKIGPLSLGAAQSIVSDGFATTGRDSGLTASRAATFTGGHPHRLMQVADSVWQQVGRGQSADDRAWNDGLSSLRLAVDEGLRRLHDTLPLGHRRVLRLVAHDQSPHGAFAGVLDLASASATHARDGLLDDGMLVRTVGKDLKITDPLLSDWIRRTFPL